MNFEWIAYIILQCNITKVITHYTITSKINQNMVITMILDGRCRKSVGINNDNLSCH